MIPEMCLAALEIRMEFSEMCPGACVGWTGVPAMRKKAGHVGNHCSAITVTVRKMTFACFWCLFQYSIIIQYQLSNQVVVVGMHKQI